MALAKAVCVLRGAPGVHGVIRLQQPGTSPSVSVSGRVTGLVPGSKHGLRVLLFGDESDGPNNLGGIFNPFNKLHCGRGGGEDRPIGALGNITADAEGTASFDFSDAVLKLFGPLSILGRALGVTEREDDCGASGSPDGNAGAVLAAGVIGIAALPPLG